MAVALVFSIVAHDLNVPAGMTAPDAVLLTAAPSTLTPVADAPAT
jgi:hypothetical protein